MIKVKNNLTGQRFGKLIVIKQTEDYVTPKGKHDAQWLCKCDCGSEYIARGIYLKDKRVLSCGCFNKESHKKYNTYDLTGNYGIGYTSKGEEFYFDLEDYDLIKDYCWILDSNGYVASNDFNNNYKQLKLHKLLLFDAQIIDHINHKKFDNQKHNLRIVTHSQNQMNKNLHSKNTSGVIGVSWHKKTNKWVSYINIDKKRINLGLFVNFKDAVKARKDAEEKYFGEYSYDNSMGYKNG